MRGRKHDLNIRGAYLHMLGDAGASAGVVVAGLLIPPQGCSGSIRVVSLILVGSDHVEHVGTARDSVNLALDAVPAGIDPDEVEAMLGEPRRRRRGARPPHLGDEHDRRRADGAPHQALPRRRRCTARHRHAPAARPVRHRPRDASGGAGTGHPSPATWRRPAPSEIRSSGRA